ncbi:MAG: GNAT family N-acetyltransferase [Patescibacteria group bacterium]
MYVCRVIKSSKIKGFKKNIRDFYKKYYTKKYKNILESTSFVVVCLYNGKIVGACRVLSDLNRFAFLLDLRVSEKFQSKGIGKNIVKKIIEECRSLKVEHINLSTAHNEDWLVNFYKKIGFKPVSKYTHMEYGKS